jgi:mono/diheme cytochrome c family protein
MKFKQSHIVVAGLLSCQTLLSCDNSAPKVQYVPDMADAPTLKPQENYLEPPEHVVAMNAVIYPRTAEDAEATLKNPLPGDDKVLKLGKKMYETYCVVCHGADGKGQGTITDVYLPAPNVTDPMYIKRQDGFFFHRITFGIRVMPGYGHATMPHERWAIVHYLRQLQGGEK